MKMTVTGFMASIGGLSDWDGDMAAVTMGFLVAGDKEAGDGKSCSILGFLRIFDSFHFESHVSWYLC
ncbi:hypothetical protein HanRHA438_Chr17g0815771 [Helianthus annuus]|nr:hypothetical protein HanRHA438_Chr17g0815771 [Helianthus annuus]